MLTITPHHLIFWLWSIVLSDFVPSILMDGCTLGLSSSDFLSLIGGPYYRQGFFLKKQTFFSMFSYWAMISQYSLYKIGLRLQYICLRQSTIMYSRHIEFQYPKPMLERSVLEKAAVDGAGLHWTKWFIWFWLYVLYGSHQLWDIQKSWFVNMPEWSVNNTAAEDIIVTSVITLSETMF